jgi:hypothetical protein
MTTRKGLLTPEQQDFIAEVLDEFFKFKNPLYEKFDKMVFKILVKVGDDVGLDKIKPSWKEKFIPMIDAAMDGKQEEVRLYLVDLLNEKIDIPAIDEEQELMIFDAFTKFLAAAVDFYIQKKKQK